MTNPFSLLRRLNTRGRIGFGLVALSVAFILIYGLVRWNDGRKSGNVTKKDAAIEVQVQQDLKQAEVHGDNANNAAAKREVVDAEVNRSRQRRDEARKESERTKQNVRDASDRYEKTLNTRPSDLPDLSDDELCARLQKLDIPCQ